MAEETNTTNINNQPDLRDTVGPDENTIPSTVLSQGTATPEVTEAATALDTAQTDYSASMATLTLEPFPFSCCNSCLLSC